jgi:hypothetical protein
VTSRGDLVGGNLFLRWHHLFAYVRRVVYLFLKFERMIELGMGRALGDFLWLGRWDGEVGKINDTLGVMDGIWMALDLLRRDWCILQGNFEQAGKSACSYRSRGADISIKSGFCSFGIRLSGAGVILLSRDNSLSCKIPAVLREAPVEV